ncbi:MAG: coenzyme F420-0:L-glutamate ligase [bacterium]|nr:coenzyme F420-0:L-glutamate ligase [bacterium]
MKVAAYKTKLVTPQDSITGVIKESITSLPERSIVVIASKIFSTCEDRFVAKTAQDRAQKHALVRQEAEQYLDPHSSKYDLMLTIKRNRLAVNAGIDESNANDQFLLWPADPQASLNAVWRFLRQQYGVREVGVTMSDSATFPLNWGVIGVAIAHCGFNPLKSYIGKPDLFGRPMKMEQVNIMQAVTVAAVLEMGEGNERQPLAVVEDVAGVEFHDHPPTREELQELRIALEDDVYAPVLSNATWKKGGQGQR